jgi:phosphatidylserine/phosphatidylglycerophosphate/cardiolipin synthase-like enzyme
MNQQCPSRYAIHRVALSILAAVFLHGFAKPASAFDARSAAQTSTGTWQVAFAPWDNIESILVQLIDDARQQIRMQAYLFTSRRIANALITAQRRGIDVKVLADEAQSHLKSSKIEIVAEAGIPVWLETRYQSAHNKILLIDAASAQPVVVTGSFNFTWTAQHKNAENILISRSDTGLATRYALNWQRHQSQAKVYPTATPYPFSPDRK